jgi:hypothetical protein
MRFIFLMGIVSLPPEVNPVVVCLSPEDHGVEGLVSTPPSHIHEWGGSGFFPILLPSYHPQSTAKTALLFLSTIQYTIRPSIVPPISPI